MSNLSSQRARVSGFLVTALRTWADAGYDAGQGTFLEALDFGGRPLPGINRRGRVQTRQIYVYALAHADGYDDESQSYLKLAQSSMPKAEAIYGRGGWYFKADPQGNVIDDNQLTYDQAFLILSLAGLYAATQQQEYIDKAEAAYRWLDTVRHPAQPGFHLGVPHDPVQPREQNPHMHLFEACIEAGLLGRQWRERAEELYHLAAKHFILPNGALVEFFTQDWRPDPKVGSDIQPGHNFEWVWLLRQYKARYGGDDRTLELIERVYGAGLAWGLDASGLGFDEIRPGGEVLRGTKRLWVECEVLKGHLGLWHLTHDDKYMRRAENVVEQIFARFLIEEKGVWYDQLDERGSNISQNAPASTFYHVYVALQEFIKAAGSYSCSCSCSSAGRETLL